jgi:uncharacterized glyoxalase superfamily protein PhnB
MIDWLAKAFGFAIEANYADNGVVGHAELSLGGSIIMLSEARDDAYGAMVGAAVVPGGKSTYIAIDDIDALHARAKAAGATILEAPTDRDHGSRDFICADPQGNVWSFGTYRPQAKA